MYSRDYIIPTKFVLAVNGAVLVLVYDEKKGKTTTTTTTLHKPTEACWTMEIVLLSPSPTSKALS